MILYHGSYIQIEKPKILVHEKGRDFGFGFYTTTIKEQAERWAIRTARLNSIKFDRTENALKSLFFKSSYIVKSVNWRNF